MISTIDSSIIINCQSTHIRSVKENKTLLQIINLLGEKTEKKSNKILFYLYDNGTVEKKMIIE